MLKSVRFIYAVGIALLGYAFGSMEERELIPLKQTESCCVESKAAYNYRIRRDESYIIEYIQEETAKRNRVHRKTNRQSKRQGQSYDFFDEADPQLSIVVIIIKGFQPIGGGKPSNETCVGHLLTTKHVITLASCVCTYDTLEDDFFIVHPTLITIRVGSYLLDKYGSVYYCHKVCVHPSHVETAKPYESVKDVAVLTLHMDVKLTDEIEPAEMADAFPRDFAEDILYKICRFASWSVTKPRTKKYNVAVIKKLADCGYEGEIDENVIFCAFGRTAKAEDGIFGSGLFCDGRILGLICFFNFWEPKANGRFIVHRIDDDHEFIKSAIQSHSNLLQSKYTVIISLNVIYKLFSL